MNSTATGLGGLLRGSASKPAPARARTRSTEVLDNMTREEIAHRIKRLDDRERFLALSSAPLGVAVGVALTVITVHLNPAVGHAKHEAVSTIYIEGAARILLSGVVVAAAMTRRRSFVGFALLFLGTSMGCTAVRAALLGARGLPDLARVQVPEGPDRQGRDLGEGGWARGRTSVGRVPANPRAAGRAGAAAARQPRTRPRVGAAARRPAPTGPTPSKRYTPPRPDPATAARPAVLGVDAGSAPPSTRSAERSSRRISWRRRTSERGVGSSPSARSTSTSVIMPTTVE